jgi:sugar O-acyltransferase (sialic acid O-acetyltransferase NeuD family)
MVAYILSYQDDIEIVGFIDDDQNQMGCEYKGIPVLGSASILKNLQKKGVTEAIVSIGSNKIRGQIADQLVKLGFGLINAIHPTAIISKHVRIGHGVIIGSGVNLYVNAVIGNNVFIGPGVIVSHDSIVRDNVLLSVGSVIGARVDIDQYAFVGAGATVMPPGWGKNARLRIEQNACVGVGAVVIKDVPQNAVVAGVPAKILKYQEIEDIQS